jgi:hypothetical protein
MNRLLLAIVILMLLDRSMPAAAIEVRPSAAEVAAALEQGRAAAKDRIPPDRLYAWFGSSEPFEPRGFIMTKLVGLRVMAAHFALRGEQPSEAEVQRILDEPSILVSVTMFGDGPAFAVESYLVLVQGDRIIKPQTVRFDGRAQRTSVWPRAPAYQAKVVASFPYTDFDLHAPTKISVFPRAGGEVTFDLDFSSIP